MDKRSCRECGADVLILPCADLGGRRVAFEVFKVPVASLPGLRQAWAYLRHRGVVRLAGRARVPDRALLRHRCDPSAWAQLDRAGAGWC
jgi:hypothetical protein